FARVPMLACPSVSSSAYEDSVACGSGLNNGGWWGLKGLLEDFEEVGLCGLPRIGAHEAFDGEGFFGETRELIAVDAKVAEALGNADGGADALDGGDGLDSGGVLG